LSVLEQHQNPVGLTFVSTNDWRTVFKNQGDIELQM